MASTAAADMNVKLTVKMDHNMRMEDLSKSIAQSANSKLGRMATIRGCKHQDVYSITAVMVRLEPKGYSEEVEIARVDCGIVERFSVDACMLTIEDDETPAEVIAEIAALPMSAVPSLDDTVILTAKGKEEAAKADPFGELRVAVTALTRLEHQIPALAELALPIGTRVNTHLYGEGTIAGKSSDYLPTYMPVKLDSLAVTGEEKVDVRLSDISVNGEFLDANHIPF